MGVFRQNVACRRRRKFVTVMRIMRLGSSDRGRTLHRVMTCIQAVGGLVVPLVGVALKFNVENDEIGLRADVLRVIQENALVILIVFTVLTWAASVIKYYYGRPWIWGLVKTLLEELHCDVFRGQAVSAQHDRVTLFKKRPWRLRFGFCPSTDWLCAVERSHHMGRRKRVWFRAKDDGKDLKGVAGATWGEGNTILKDRLPLLTKDASQDQIQIYAKETFIEVDYIKKKLKKSCTFPRSLCGILVEVGLLRIDGVRRG